MPTSILTPEQFIPKWQAVTVSEMAGYREHVKYICRLVGQDKTGATVGGFGRRVGPCRIGRTGPRS